MSLSQHSESQQNQMSDISDFGNLKDFIKKKDRELAEAHQTKILNKLRGLIQKDGNKLSIRGSDVGTLTTEEVIYLARSQNVELNRLCEPDGWQQFYEREYGKYQLGNFTKPPQGWRNALLGQFFYAAYKEAKANHGLTQTALIEISPYHNYQDFDLNGLVKISSIPSPELLRLAGMAKFPTALENLVKQELYEHSGVNYNLKNIISDYVTYFPSIAYRTLAHALLTQYNIGQSLPIYPNPNAEASPVESFKEIALKFLKKAKQFTLLSGITPAKLTKPEYIKKLDEEIEECSKKIFSQRLFKTYPGNVIWNLRLCQSIIDVSNHNFVENYDVDFHLKEIAASITSKQDQLAPQACIDARKCLGELTELLYVGKNPLTRPSLLFSSFLLPNTPQYCVEDLKSYLEKLLDEKSIGEGKAKKAFGIIDRFINVLRANNPLSTMSITKSLGGNAESLKEGNLKRKAEESKEIAALKAEVEVLKQINEQKTLLLDEIMRKSIAQDFKRLKV